MSDRPIATPITRAKPTASGRGLVALMTDFGTRDWYVGTLKGIVLGRCPRARLVDLTHEIAPQDIAAGAFTLAAAAPWFPQGTVFLAVIDPGVGTSRKLLAARADGHYFVGPDNGVFTLSWKYASRLTIVELTNRRYWLAPISRTFQARDILAPVAAHLALGESLSALGPVVTRAVPLELPGVQRTSRNLLGQIVHIDAYGNLITNLSPDMLRRTRGVALRFKQQAVRVVSSYAQGRPGELVALIGSLGLVELATRNGSAAWSFSAKRGDEVRAST